MPASTSSSPAERIRRHLSGVEALRSGAAEAGTAAAVQTIKRLQAARFAHTYSDFLANEEYAAAARFFLEELYGVRDFSQRDRQFARIAGGLERLFPAAVGELAVDLVELHALTERLDHDMGVAWKRLTDPMDPGRRYLAAWRAVGSRPDRDRQLAVVGAMGSELEQLTRKKSLRTALRLMRGPARAAGLDALQQFLEAGFDAFGSMARPQVLMQAIQARESAWLEQLFSAPEVPCAAELSQIWQGLDG